MRRLLDTTCPRCGCTTTVEGLTFREVETVALAHVCPDGERRPAGRPVERIVPGPGERTKLPEERGR